MSPLAQAAHPPMPLICLPSRLRDPRVFSGLGDEDIEEWADFYARVSLHNRWDDPTKLANVIFYLSDVAKTWFLNHETEMPSWDAFFSRIKEIFGRPEDRKATARKKLATRSQLRSEGYTSYIEDVLTLCKKIDPNMPEAERVRHVLKGIADEAVNLFVLQPPADVTAIVTICQSLEAARRQRIGATASLHTHGDILAITQNDGTLEETIRRIVREELTRFFATPTTEVTGASQHIRNLIRTELTQAPTMPCAPVITPPQPTYAEVLLRPPNPALQHTQVATLMTTPSTWQRPQPTWRTPDNRPTCYYCGIRGHINRYCRRRRADENRNWQQSQDENYTPAPRYHPGHSQNQSYADRRPPEAYQRNPRPQSLSPYRRRRSPSPMNTGLPRTSFPSEN